MLSFKIYINMIVYSRFVHFLLHKNTLSAHLDKVIDALCLNLTMTTFQCS